MLLEGKRSTEIDGVCIIQVFIAWVGSVSSIWVILGDLNTSTGWGQHDLHELHIYVNRTYMTYVPYLTDE